jgi:hypothetical protein
MGILQLKIHFNDRVNRANYGLNILGYNGTSSPEVEGLLTCGKQAVPYSPINPLS